MTRLRGRCGEDDDLDLAEREREWIDRPGEERYRGHEEHGDLRAGGKRDLSCKLDVAAMRNNHCTAVLGCVPHDRDHNGGDEEVAEVCLLGERLDRADNDLGDQRGHDRCSDEHEERNPQTPRLLVARLLGEVELAMPAQVEPGDNDVHEQEDDRDAERDPRDRAALVVSAPARDRGS